VRVWPDPKESLKKEEDRTHVLVRFRVERPRLFPNSYMIHVRDAIITVSVPDGFCDRRALTWTWIDGTEYAWLWPHPPDLEVLHLVSGERCVCRGECFLARKRANRGDRVVTLSRWEIHGQTVVLQGSRIWCRYFPRILTLREAGGKRLASWVAGRLEGALRRDTPEEVVPVVLGIVLTTVHDFWGTCGD
jgi:hypothetical protein